MRKTLIVLGCMSLGLAHAQQDYEKRVGINTDAPRASLEVKAVNNGYTQGILFPHIDENEKARWTQDEAKGLVAGTVIWNTTKLCLDYFDGTNWQCTDGTKTNEHPTPWKPGATSFTGKAVWGDDAGEVISIAKNDCPTGQTGAAINYPVDASQHITYTATSTVSQEDANQKAIALMNAAEKQQERQRLAQEYANQSGTCKSNLTEIFEKNVCFNTGTKTLDGYWVVVREAAEDTFVVAYYSKENPQLDQFLTDIGKLPDGKYWTTTAKNYENLRRKADTYGPKSGIGFTVNVPEGESSGYGLVGVLARNKSDSNQEIPLGTTYTFIKSPYSGGYELVIKDVCVLNFEKK